MKQYRRIVSFFIVLILVITMISASMISSYAAQITVANCDELADVLSSGLSDTVVRLSNDITASCDIELKNASKVTLELNGHTLSLGDYQLKITDVSGLNYILGNQNSAIGGKIVANGDAVSFSGTAGTLIIGNNVEISSQNGNGIVNATSGRSITLTGVRISSPKGCGVLLTSNQNLVYSSNKIISADKKASSLQINYDNFGILTQIEAKFCIGVLVLNNASEYNVNKSGVKASVTLRFGAVLRGFDAVAHNNSQHLYIVGDKVEKGDYSENISSVYNIAIDSSSVLLRNAELFSVIKRSTIGTIDSEASFKQALGVGGAYYVTDDFAVSESAEITSDANVIIDGQGHRIEFNNSGSYIRGDIPDGIKVTMSNLIFDGKNKADSLYTKVVTDLLSKPNTIYLFDCSDSSFKDKVLAFRYKLETDSALSSPYTINTGEKISLDLNGHTVSTLGDFAAFNVDGELSITDSDGNGKVLAAEPFDTTDGGSVSVYGGTYNSSVYNYIAEDLAGFNIKNDDGTSTVYSGSGVLRSATAKESSDVMRYGNLHNLETLGYQKKATGKLKGNGVDTQGIRLVTVVNSGLIKSANIKDYGYVIAKYDGDKEIGELNFSGLRPWSYNGEKVISCRNSTNNFANEYGLYSAETKYKYVTLAVNGMKDGDRIVARFYIQTTDGKLYFSNYSDYDGILAKY